MKNSPLARKITKALAVLAMAIVPFAIAPESRAFAHDEAPTPIPAEMSHVDVTEHLDAPIPGNAHFRDQDGQNVTIGDYFGKRPIALILAYHRCPVLCSLIQHAAATTFKELAELDGKVVGKDFDVIVLSIDPTDTPEIAKQKRDEIVSAYGHPETVGGFHYLVGEKAEIDRVANAVGFGYQYDERQNQYAHPSVLMIVKPNGEMARYLYGLAFEARDLKFGILEASEGKSISTVDRVILYCYHYDAQAGKYTIIATRVMQIGAGFSALCLFALLAWLWRMEKKIKRDRDIAEKTSHEQGSALHPTPAENP